MSPLKSTTGLEEVSSRTVKFDNNDLAMQVFGPREQNLKFLEKHIPVVIKGRGSEVTMEGTVSQIDLAEKCLGYIRDLALKGSEIKKTDIADALRNFKENGDVDLSGALRDQPIVALKKKVYPRTLNQKIYVDAIKKHDLVFGVGPAGTGKTYLAMAVGVAKIMRGEIDRIVLTRPAVEAGEKLGFLPGDLAEKVNPYLRPLLDALHEMLDYERAEKMLASGQIEIAPIAFMRGRTLNDSYVILDEAQNCTREQMKMFLTRLGENSTAVITGDITQIDLPRDTKSGLIQALKILSGIEGIYIHQFKDTDVVRHPLVAEIIRAYDQAQKIP